MSAAAWAFLFTQTQAIVYAVLWLRACREIERIEVERDKMWDLAHGIGSPLDADS